MCYHVQTPTKREQKNLHNEGFRIAEDRTAHNNGYDHPNLATTFQYGNDVAEPRQWGLIREWAKTVEQAKWQQKHALFARSDELFNRTMYKDIALKQRCLIWMESFDERHHAATGDIVPFRVQMRDHSLISVGGLWSIWRNPETGELVKSCNIITTEANKLMAQVHNKAKRMPLIISEADRSMWLNLRLSQAEVTDLMRPLPDGLLEAFPLEPMPNSLF